jgi:hypothetical protein
MTGVPTSYLQVKNTKQLVDLHWQLYGPFIMLLLVISKITANLLDKPLCLIVMPTINLCFFVSI